MALITPRFSALANRLPLFRAWLAGGIWQPLHTPLREKLREKVGRQATPSAGILDSQSVKITGQKGFGGYDGGNKVNGRKRHALVNVVVSPANSLDTDGAEIRFEPIQGRFPRLQHIGVDGGYQGKIRPWLKKHAKITAEVVIHAWSGKHRGQDDPEYLCKF